MAATRTELPQDASSEKPCGAGGDFPTPRTSQPRASGGQTAEKRPPLRTLALDPATHCGFAHSSGASGTFDLSVRRDESAGMRLVRFEGKLNEVLRDVGVDLVVYEAARHGAPAMQGALVIQAMIQGVLVAWCERNGIEYRGYSPSEIKKHATGKGGAKKAVVLEAAVHRWPHVRDDNEADALWLLDLALREYGNVPMFIAGQL